MSKSRSIEISLLPTTTPEKFVEVMLMFSNGRYFVAATPVTVTFERGFESRSFMCFSGKSATVETAPRFSAKHLAALSGAESTKAVARTLVEHVLVKEGLALVAPYPSQTAAGGGAA